MIFMVAYIHSDNGALCAFPCRARGHVVLARVGTWLDRHFVRLPFASRYYKAADAALERL